MALIGGRAEKERERAPSSFFLVPFFILLARSTGRNRRAHSHSSSPFLRVARAQKANERKKANTTQTHQTGTTCYPGGTRSITRRDVRHAIFPVCSYVCFACSSSDCRSFTPSRSVIRNRLRCAPGLMIVGTVEEPRCFFLNKNCYGDYILMQCALLTHVSFGCFQGGTPVTMAATCRIRTALRHLPEGTRATASTAHSRPCPTSAEEAGRTIRGCLPATWAVTTTACKRR